jgi:hypothetical protein
VTQISPPLPAHRLGARSSASRRATAAAGAALASAGFFTACGSDLVLPPSGPAGGGGGGGALVRVTPVAGDGQQGTVGQPLADSLVVRVVGIGGAPLAGRRVAFEGTSAGDLAPDTARTDAEGRASARWVLGTVAGSQTATAKVTDTIATPANFAAEALPGAASAVAGASGDGQRASRSTTLPEPLVVKVTDRFGNPVAGVDVSWRVTRGGGSLSDSHPTTGDDGRASVRWTLGESGRQQVSATASRLSGSPVQFSATIS